jgi:hypothetical protein
MAHDIIHKPSKRKTKNPKSRKRTYTSNNARQKRKHIKKTKRNRKPFVNMRGGEGEGEFKSEGLFELTGDAMLYILTNIVKLSSNMIAASVGYVPVNNNLGTPGAATDSSLFKELTTMTEYAKVPVEMLMKMSDGVVSQYLNIVNGAMRINSPMIQASLAVTIRILQAQIALATKALNNPAFIATLRTALDALEVASDEIVGAIDPVAASILSKLSPIITRTIGSIFGTIGTSTLSGMQAMPYLGTVLAALSSFDAITRLYISAINAGTATGSIMFDGYTDTLYRLENVIKSVKNRISGTTSGMNMPAMPSTPTMPSAPGMPPTPTMPSAPAMPSTPSLKKK